MAAPTLLTEGTINAVTTGSPAPTIPTHQANDILIARAIVWAPSTAGDAPQIPTPTGSVTYTLIGSQIGQPAGTRDGWLAWWWARADSAGETIAFTAFATAGWSGTATTCAYAAVVDVFRGCATSGDPWDQVVQTGPHTAANANTPAITTVSGTERLISVQGNSQDNTGMGAASPYTASALRTDTTGTDSGFKNWRIDNTASTQGAVATTTTAPGQGAYAFTGIVFKPPPATTPVDGDPLDLNWDLVAEVTGDALDLKWDTAAEVTGDSLDLKWDTNVEVTGDSLELLWDVRNEVTGDALDLKWDLAGTTGVVHRAFDGSGQITSDAGEVNNLTGAFTLAAVIRTTTTAVTPILTHTNAVPTTLLSMSLSATNFLRIAGAATRTSAVLSVAPADGWVIFVTTKAAGTVIPRFHLYKAGSWTHEAAPNTLADIATQSGGYTYVGSAPGLTSTLDLAVAGEWSSALSDGDVETLDYASQNWADLSPLSLWNFDQTVTTDTIPDLIGANDLNGDAGAPIGTDGPAGWDYDVVLTTPVDGDPLDLVWDVASEVTGDALDLKWDLAGAVTGDALDLIWDTRTEVTGDALDLLWDTRSEVNGDALDLKWDTNAAVTGDALDLLWDTRAEVTGDSLDLVWDLLTEAGAVNGDSLELIWDVPAEVNGTALDLIWDTTAEVNGTALDLLWDLIAQIDGTALDLVWDVRTTVDGTALDLLWDTTAEVAGAVLDLLWDVRVVVDGDALELVWDVATAYEPVDGAALTLLWDVRGPEIVVPPGPILVGLTVDAYLDLDVRQWADTVDRNGTAPPATPLETQTMTEDGATFASLSGETDYLFVASQTKRIRTHRPMKPYREVTEWITVGSRT